MCTNPRYIINPLIKKLREKGDFNSDSVYMPESKFYIKTLNYKSNGLVSVENYDNTFRFQDSQNNWHSVPHYIKVGCRKCHECRKQQCNEIVSRLQLELNKHKDFAFFVTLTYSDDFLPLNSDDCNTFIPSLRKSDLQKFFKRLRINLSRDNVDITNFKYYAIGEYGFKNTNNCRPHYHCIIYTDQLPVNIFHDYVATAWELGNIDVKICETNMLRYCANAHTSNSKFFPRHELADIPFCIFSKGLGVPNDDDFSYIRVHKNVYVDGCNYPLPKYVKNKVFRKDEQRRLFLIRSNSNGCVDDFSKQLDDKRNYTSSELNEIRVKYEHDNKELTKRHFDKYVLKRK